MQLNKNITNIKYLIMAGQTQFNATLLAEIQNNIGSAATLTDVGKTLAAVIKQATAEALLKYTDVIKPNADTKEKAAFEKQSKLIEPLISLMIIDKVVTSFQEELENANVRSPAVQQSHETLVSLRDETFKSIKQIGTDIKIFYQIWLFLIFILTEKLPLAM